MDAIPSHSTVDQRLAMVLTPALSERAELLRNISDAVQLADADGDGEALEAVLRKQFGVETQLFDRLEAVVKGLAADRVFIVQEGALVHALAGRMALTWNTALGTTDDEFTPATKESYIGTAQSLLANLKNEGVIS